MAYIRQTSIVGTRNGEFAHTYMAGHVNPENTLGRAKRLNIAVKKIEHCVFDTSGRGRSGHDGRWQYVNGEFVKVSDWSEFGIEH